MSGKWLEALHEAHGVIPCRQELPPHAIIRDADAAEAAEMQIFAISYPWLSPQHPDPSGFHLGFIAPTLKIYMALNGQKDVAVFWDWCSIHQEYYAGTDKPPVEYPEGLSKVTRTDAQGDAFRGALRDINAWYSSSGIVKLVQSIPPEDPSIDVAVRIKWTSPHSVGTWDKLLELLKAKGIRCFPGSCAVENVAPGQEGGKAGVKAGFHIVSVNEVPTRTATDVVAALQTKMKEHVLFFKRKQYDERGWCVFERRVSELVTPSTGIVDFSHFMFLVKKTPRLARDWKGAILQDVQTGKLQRGTNS